METRDRRAVLTGIATVAAASAMAGPAFSATPPAARAAPALVHAFDARVLIGPPQEIGLIDGARKRVIPITGGSFEGRRLGGTILPGGADWQTIRADGVADIAARYTLRERDGTLLSVANPGFRRGPAAVLARIAAGEDVDPALYYFRTTPRFEVASDSRHAWLAASVFVCTAARYRDHVRLSVFEVQ
jgi:hypothetical protein